MISYEFYKINSCNKALEEMFDYLCKQAIEIVKKTTYGRVSGNHLTKNVKMCICELIDYLAMLCKNANNEQNIRTESVGDYKIEYFPSVMEYSMESMATIKNICLKWLVYPNNFMYCGLE